MHATTYFNIPLRLWNVQEVCYCRKTKFLSTFKIATKHKKKTQNKWGKAINPDNPPTDMSSELWLIALIWPRKAWYHPGDLLFSCEKKLNVEALLIKWLKIGT